MLSSVITSLATLALLSQGNAQVLSTCATGSRASIVLYASPSPKVAHIACAQSAVADAGCAALTDLGCVCGSSVFITSAATCIKAQCGEADLKAVAALAQSACGGAVAIPSSLLDDTTSTGTDSATSTTSGAATTTSGTVTSTTSRATTTSSHASTATTQTSTSVNGAAATGAVGLSAAVGVLAMLL